MSPVCLVSAFPVPGPEQGTNKCTMNKWIYNFLRRPLWLLTDPRFAENSVEKLNFCQNRIRAYPRTETTGAFFPTTPPRAKEDEALEKNTPETLRFSQCWVHPSPVQGDMFYSTLGIRHKVGCPPKVFSGLCSVMFTFQNHHQNYVLSIVFSRRGTW